jgi:hypothetical protein
MKIISTENWAYSAMFTWDSRRVIPRWKRLLRVEEAVFVK